MTAIGGGGKGGRDSRRESSGAVGEECRLAVVFDMRLSRFAGSVSKAAATGAGRVALFSQHWHYCSATAAATKIRHLTPSTISEMSNTT